VSGFGRLVRAELTKLLTVPRWVLGLAAMAGLTLGFGLLTAQASGTDDNEARTFSIGPDGTAVLDGFYFVHRPASGDATVTVRVADQEASHPDARAGLIFKQGTTSGSRYASVAVTPAGGVRFDADYAGGGPSVAGEAPQWLRLVREGSSFTGYVSADGDDWREVGSADLPDIGDDLEVGLFVTSPGEVRIERGAGSTSVGEVPTVGTATFTDLALSPDPASGDDDTWQGEPVTGAGTAVGRGPAPADGQDGPAGPPPSQAPEQSGGGLGEVGFHEDGGVYTVTGTGDIGPDEPPDDTVQLSLFGAVFGLMALAAVAVLFVTAEHRRHMVWTTFAAAPHRRRVLAAKAVVIGAVALVGGLATVTVTYLAAQPVLRSRGFGPPAYAPTSLTDPGVARALVGTAVLLTAFALLGLALGSLLRRSSGAIAAVFSLGVVPLFAALIVPAASGWLLWLTPAGGFAVQRAKPPTNEVAEPWSQMNPWAGLAVTVAYALAALALALWTIDRRDA
jgi:hypothetical protein